jgi:hypothetical protein
VRRPFGLAEKIGPQDVNGTAPCRVFAALARIAFVSSHLEILLQALSVRGRLFVEDDKVDAEPLHVQVLMCGQQLPDHTDVCAVLDACKQDRTVARNAELPEFGHGQAIALQ